MKLDLKNIRDSLKRNDNSCLKEIFLVYSDYCIKKLLRQTSCTQQDADDIFIDAIINFRERLLGGKIEYLTNIQGYLYSTCYNMWMMEYRKSKRHESHAENIKRFYEDTTTFPEKEELHSLANNAISSLGEKCQHVIKLFYLNNLTMIEIAEEMGFASAGVAKTLKARCYKKLMEEARKQMTQKQVYLSR